MMEKFDKLYSKVADGAAKITGQLVSKSKAQLDRASLHAKLAKTHRQLGALVYTMKKNGDENEPMLAWYIAEIDRIKAKLALLDDDKKDSSFHVYGDESSVAAEADEDAMFRGGGEC